MNNELITFIAISLITFIPTGILLAYMPYFTRKTENFGVSIPSSMYDRKDFNSMRKKYAQRMLTILLITVIVTFSSIKFLSVNMMFVFFTITLLLYLLASFLMYLPFHKKMKEIKQTENWYADRKATILIDMKFRDEKLSIAYGWFIIPFLVIVLTTIIPIMMFDSIPEQIPIHNDFAGNISFEAKSIEVMLIMPGLQVLMLLLFMAMNFMIKHAKQQVDAENPERSKLQNTLYRRRWSIYTFYLALLTILLLAYMQFGFIYQSILNYDLVVIIGFTAVTLLGTIGLAINTGQGGSRIKVESTTDDSVITRDDDKYWKLGQFYVNKNDPAIFVEKRFGIGWTNNWAHPVSWIIIIVILAVAIVPFFFI